jgi:DNA-binding response OmpR family regulator
MVHILLIEDNPGDVFMIREALRTCSVPADVIIAGDGEEGLNLLRADDPPVDLVLLDLNLPKFSGLVVLERSRRIGRPPVVIFSASDREEDQALALALGAREFVTKPPGYAAFSQSIHGILERWAASEATQSHIL